MDASPRHREYQAQESEAVHALIAHTAARVAPPPRLTVSGWAGEYRELSRESSAASGRWQNDRTPYLVGVMDAASNPWTQEIIVQAGAQVGKTEAILNMIGYYIAQDPSSMLVVQPNIEMLQAFSKERLATMIRDTEVLNCVVDDPKSRDSSNTISHKLFPGGKISIVTANSPSGLAGRPCRIVLLDEIDRFPASSGTEGDPVKLATRRQDTFAHNRKLIACSTPTYATTSKIHRLYTSEITKRHVYHVDCIKCTKAVELTWSLISWVGDDPKTAHLVCPACKEKLTDVERNRMVKKGRWYCLDPEKDDYRVGFKLSGLVSPWLTLEKIVKEYLDARSDVETLKVFTNTVLGEVFEEHTEGIDHNTLYMSRVDYAAEAPSGVLAITCAIDLQGDRAEMEVCGWGQERTSWSLGYYRVFGDINTRKFWDEVATQLERRFKHESGISLPIDATVIDSGFSTNLVYEFVERNAWRRVMAIKGVQGTGRAIIAAPTKKKINKGTSKVDLYIVGVDEAKTLVYQLLQVRDPSLPGFCHFPRNEEMYHAEYFKALTSERVTVSFRNGFAQKKWIKPAHQSNEALDIRAYNLAAIVALNPVWSSLKRRIVRMKREEEKIERRVDNAAQGKPAAASKRERRGYINGWKD